MLIALLIILTALQGYFIKISSFRKNKNLIAQALLYPTIINSSLNYSLELLNFGRNMIAHRTDITSSVAMAA